MIVWSDHVLASLSHNLFIFFHAFCWKDWYISFLKKSSKSSEDPEDILLIRSLHHLRRYSRKIYWIFGKWASWVDWGYCYQLLQLVALKPFSMHLFNQTHIHRPIRKFQKLPERFKRFVEALRRWRTVEKLVTSASFLQTTKGSNCWFLGSLKWCFQFLVATLSVTHFNCLICMYDL